MITASAAAKIILFGEHAVVYGQPAIAIPVSSLRASVEVQPNASKGLQIVAADLNQVLPVSIDMELVDSALVRTAQLVLETAGVSSVPDLTLMLRSEIPMAGGLGSGAAVTTAIARGLLSALELSLSDEALNALVYRVEEIYHGTPSGVDNTVIVYERPVYFIRGQKIETVTVGQSLQFVVADTGQASLTRLAVGDVRHLMETDPAQYRPIIEDIGRLTQEARSAIESSDLTSVGNLMIQNHALLQRLTVSSTKLDKLVEAALSAGALGAKLSGGGRGGNMIALAADDRTCEDVMEALRSAGAERVFATTLAATPSK